MLKYLVRQIQAVGVSRQANVSVHCEWLVHGGSAYSTSANSGVTPEDRLRVASCSSILGIVA